MFPVMFFLTLLFALNLAQTIPGSPNECQIINYNYYTETGAEATLTQEKVDRIKHEIFAELYPKSCEDLSPTSSGYYTIYPKFPKSKKEVQVYCPVYNSNEFYPKSCKDLSPTSSGYYTIYPGFPKSKREIQVYCPVYNSNEFYPKSCKDLSTTSSGYYTIYPGFPKSKKEIQVYCRFNTFNVTTILEHDSEEEVNLPIKDSCDRQGCYKRNINYNASMEQIVAVIEASTYCRQFIKYRCLNTYLLFGGYGWWENRVGDKMQYWGGATSRRQYFCACGETGSCYKSTSKCNCDFNGEPEQADEGYLDDKTQLPVTKLAFGDMDGHDNGYKDERGWHTLGPLECW